MAKIKKLYHLVELSGGSDGARTLVIDISAMLLTGCMVSVRSKILYFRTFRYTKKRREVTITELSPEHPRNRDCSKLLHQP